MGCGRRACRPACAAAPRPRGIDKRCPRGASQGLVPSMGVLHVCRHMTLRLSACRPKRKVQGRTCQKHWLTGQHRNSHHAPALDGTHCRPVKHTGTSSSCASAVSTPLPKAKTTWPPTQSSRCRKSLISCPGYPPTAFICHGGLPIAVFHGRLKWFHGTKLADTVGRPHGMWVVQQSSMYYVECM